MDKIKKEYLEIYNSIDLDNDLLIVSESKPSETKDLTKELVYKDLVFIKSQIDSALKQISENTNDVFCKKIESLINKYNSFINQIKSLSKTYQNPNQQGQFDRTLQGIVSQIQTLKKGLENGNDESGFAFALQTLKSDYLENIMEGKGLSELEKYKQEAKTASELILDRATESKEQIEQVRKIGSETGVGLLKDIGATMKTRYNKLKRGYMISAIVIVVFMCGYIICNKNNFEDNIKNISQTKQETIDGQVVQVKTIERYRLFFFIPNMLLYSILFYVLGFCIKEYKKSDTMYIFNENKESIANAFILLNLEKREEKDNDIKKDLFAKTLDGLYKIPDSVYSTSNDSPIHERVIEKIIDKIPTSSK